MAAYLDRTPFANPVHERAARNALEFPHHLSHPVGMAVHDVSHYRGKPLRPGIVFSVDPQMRVPEERLYLRVEDTVVVTEYGCENLTAAAPLEMDEVEATMREPGMLGQFQRSRE